MGNHVFIETVKGPIRIYTREVTGVAKSPYGLYDIVVYHGRDDPKKHVYITQEQAVEFVGKMWSPWNCRIAAPCFGRNESDDVPSGCVGCLLRKELLNQKAPDLRVERLSERSWMPLGFALVGGFFLFCGLSLWGQNVDGEREKRQTAYWQARAVRAEATFKRQSVATEKGRE